MTSARSITLLAWSLGLSLSCGTAEPGAQGPAGPPGPAGPAGMDLTAGFADCPIGYTRDPSVTNIVLCKRGSDEVVRVGVGGSAFWIDRYEASIWDSASGGNKQYGVADDVYPNLAKSGWHGAVTLYALSVRGVVPSRYITWFQAHAACRSSGKRLSTRDEWLEAARATPDPGTSSGGDGQCVTVATEPRSAGRGSNCRSLWGVEDMVGNLWEWTDEWYAGLGDASVYRQPWPQMSADYGSDSISNVVSAAYTNTGAAVAGLPAAALRGGGWKDGTKAGIFALDLATAPSAWAEFVGFRCVVPR